MKKLLALLSFSTIALLNWSQVYNACFSSRNDFSFPKPTSESRAIISADFDNDGILDIVTNSYSNIATIEKINFQKGLGNGKFGPAIGSFTTNGTLSIEMQAHDFDSDGNLDIVICSNSGFHICKGNGDGTFTYDNSNSFTNAKLVQLGDFNNDGYMDFVGSISNNQYTIFLGNGTLNFSQTTATILTPSGTILNIETADMNKDGLIDLVFILNNGISVRLNNPATPGTNFTVLPYVQFTGANNPVDLAIGDINGDTYPDVVGTYKGTHNLVAVYLNTGTGSVTHHQNVVTETSPDGITCANINGDGYMDVVVANNLASTVSVLYGSASGNLSLHQTFQAPGNPKVLVVNDFNGDSYSDIVTAQSGGPFISSFIGNASNNYQETNLFETSLNSQPSSSFSGDFNADGKVDLAITESNLNQVKIYLGNGTGGFTPGATLTTGTNPVYITGEDLNGNGTIDLVVVNKGSDNISVFQGTGSGTFSAATNYSVGSQPSQAKIGKLRGSAQPFDIVVTNSGSTFFSVLLGSGSGSFGSASSVTLTATGASAIVITDYDLDGNKDVLVGFSSFTTIKRFKGDGTGNFTSNLQIGSSSTNFSNVTALEVADLDGDGDEDLLIGSEGQITRIFLTSNSSAALGSLLSPGILGTAIYNNTVNNINGTSGVVSGLKIIDINNDGKLDFVASLRNGANTGSLIAFVATSFGTNNNYVLTPTLVGFATESTNSSLSVGDFNSDGRIDAVVTNEGSNSFTLHLNTTPVISAVGPTTFCNGNSVVLNGTPATQWYEWAPTSESTQNITATTDGIYSLTSSSSWSGWCTAISDTLKVTVTPGPPAPTATASGSTTICGSGSVTLTSSSATDNQWYKDDVLIPGATNQTYNATTSGDYTVRITSGGCSSDDSNTITVSVSQAPTITASGSVNLCDGQTVTLTSDITSNILWSNGATSPSITVSTSGSYNVTNNVGACPPLTSNTIVVTVAAPITPPTISPAGPLTVCPGNPITLTSSATSGNHWSTGETSQSISVSAPGNYTVFQSVGSCNSTNSVAVSVGLGSTPATPTITASGSTTICAGQSVTLTSSAASGYLWSNGATTQSITVSTAGTYSVKTYSVSGCESAMSNTITVTVNPLPATPIISPSGSTTFCSGGSVTLISSPGTTYLWSNTSTTSSITVSTSGIYTVKITDVNGCQSDESAPVTVTVNPLPAAPTITNSGSLTFCDGGSVDLTSSAANGYLWSNSSNTQTITVNTSGSYSVQAIDANGCISPASTPVTVTVTPPPSAVTIAATGPTTFCNGGSVTIEAPTSVGYLWSNGATTQSITVSTAGSYSVQVGTPGCMSPASNVINVTVNPLPAAPTITPSGSTTFCDGGSVTLTSSPGATYLWSTSATSSSIPVTISGTYSVQITDANGCLSPASTPVSVTVNPIPAAPTISASGATEFCTGGSVTLTASAGSSYLWSNTQTTQSISVSTSGTYTVQVIENGCTSPASNATVVVVNPLPAAPTITASGSTTFCAGGSVILTSTAAQEYLWSNGATTQSITVTNSGSFYVKVKDINGCESANSVSVPVTVNANPTTPNITPNGPLVFCDGGSVTLTAPNATSYEWSNGLTTQSIIVTTSGTFTVKVTNANGCQSAASPVTTVTVNPIPAAPTITASGPTTFCAGGSVTLTSSATANNQWSTGSGNQSITVSSSGVYYVNVTENGCTSPNAAQVVTVNPLPATPNITASGSTTFCIGNSITLSAPSSAGYLWSTGETTQTITVNASGNYTVQITDNNGCTSAPSTATTVTVNPLPATPTITVGGSTTFCQGGFVTLTAPPSNSYLWSGGAGTSQSINVTTSGSYTVQVTNTNGCTSLPSAPVIVVVNPLPAAPTITASGSTTFCVGDDVILSSTAGDGYLWSNSETTQDIIVNASGTYTAQIIDLNGCISPNSNPITVTVNNLPATPTVSANGPLEFCDGSSVTLTSNTATGYLWSTGATTQSITITVSGTYTVQRINANGCVSLPSNPIDVVVNPIPAAPTITASGPTAFCSGGNVVLTSSETSNNTWSTGSGNQSITVTSGGTYTVNVTVNGCTSPNATQVVTVYALPPTPTITASGPTTFCDGGSVTLTAPSSAGYLWSTGETTQTITVNASGNYTLKVYNSNGCESVISLPTAVVVNPLPAAPTITSSGFTTFCAGSNTVLTSSFGSTYIWSTGATTQSITVGTAGNYWVKIKDANGCESPASAVVPITVNPLPAAPVISYTTPLTFCIGNSVDLTSSTGVSYLWSGGLGTNQTVTVTTSGTYSVQVYDANGCLSPPSADVTVTVNALPSTPTINASGSLTFCDGNTVDLTCQQLSTGYEWSTGDFSQTITVGVSGSYSVRRTNANGCTSAWSTPVTVVVNPIPATPTIIASGPTTFCQGSNVTLTSSSATGNTWSTTSTAQSITVSTTNTYTLTVTENGCTSAPASQSVVVNPLPITPNITSSGATTFCAGFYVDLIAAPSGYDYNWNTGSSNQAISVSTSGSYTVSITDANGCTSPVSAPMVVTVNPLPATPTITASGATEFCDGGSVTLTAPTSTAYQWSNGALTPSINATVTGSYTVKVIDINGCESAPSAPVNVTVNPLPAAPTISAGGTTTFCQGGSVVLTSTSGVGYLWSNADDNQSTTITTSGTYTAKVIDANGCLSPNSNSIAVTVNPLPPTPIITASGSTTICDGNSVTLTASAADFYNWNTGDNSQSITVDETGNYSLTVTDANGCTSLVSSVTTVTVNPIPPAPSIIPGGPTTFCQGSSVVLNSSVPTGNTWSTSSNSPAITVTTSGTYSLTQTVLGCTSPSTSIDITVNPLPPAPVITASGPVTFCTGGSVDLISSIPTNLTWNTTETTQTITVTSSGNYYATQTQLGCVSNPSNTINVVVNPIPAVPTISASGPTTFCAGNTITLTSSSPTNNLWSNGATTQSITVTNSGTFVVQVIQSGCSSGPSAPQLITVNPLPNPPTIITGTTESICDGSSVNLTSSSTAGNIWSTGEDTQTITVNTAGSYTVQVVDGNGCASLPSTPTIVTVNPIPAAPTITTSGAPSLCFGDQVTLTSSYSTGNLWNGGSTAASITVSTAGSYIVTHTDANGCISPPSLPIDVVVNPIPPAPNITSVGSTTFCQGNSVVLASSEPTGNIWSTAETTEEIVVTTSGVYSVMFVDANGCTSPSSVPVVVNVMANPPVPSITAGGPTTICQGSSVTLISSYTSGNTWSNGSTNQNINVSTGGSYTVTYTNANGCSSTSAPTVITVTPISAIPTISASGSTTICQGSSVTLTSSDPNSTWSTGASSQSIVVTSSGSYTVVGNQTGCPSQPSAPIIVTVNPAPEVPLITPSGPTTICQGDELYLFTSASGSIQWSTGYTGPVLSVTSSGTYFVNVANAYGCTASSALVNVVINSLPNVAMNPLPTVCSNAAPFTLSSGIPAGGTYTGNGVSSNVFNPAIMGAGASIITYTYTDINGCSAQAQGIISVSNCLGIEENSIEFALYPNPTDGRFMLTSTSTPMENVVIYDAQGKMVFNQSYSGLFSLEFNLNDYSNGVYYIEIISNNEVQNRMPLVINH